MAVDRGGLHYNIRVENQFSANLERFRSEIREARAEWQRLKQSLGRARTGAARGLRREAESTRNLTREKLREARASRAQSEAIGQLNSRRSIRAAALRQLREETRKQAISQERANLSAKQAFQIEKRTATAEQARSQAERDLTRTLDRRSIIEKRRQAAQERGIRLSEQERSRLGLVTEAEKRQAEQERKLAAAKERSALASQRKAQAEDQNRIRALRENIQQRAAQQERLADAQNRAARASQRQAQAEDQQRIKALRENIQQRAAATERLAAAKQRAALAAQKQAQAEDQQRVRSLRENLQQRAAQGQAFAGPLAAGRTSRFENIRQRIREFQRFNRTLRTTRQEGNRISFTFRRLFGILAAFTAARVGIQFFTEAVKEMANFNARIEQARLGIASLLTATGEVTDATGRSVSAVEQLALAQDEARRQTELLRRDALQTVSTFDDLAEAFQVAIAPGTQAGLTLDQIRQFTVQISQAAAAVGLAQNQLAEEIRSILAGTIQTRTTRIAVALGITNEDIRRAKEAGELFEFLQERFSAFTVAGEEFRGTFRGLFTNLADGLKQVLGAGGLEFFNSLKDLLDDLRGLFVSEDPLTGLVRPDPRAVAVVSAIGAGLTGAVEEAQRLQEALGFDGVAGLALVIGEAIRVGAQVLGAAIQGVVAGVNDLRAILSTVFQTIEEVTGLELFDPQNLQSTIATIVRVLTLVTGLSLVVQSLGLLLVPFTAGWRVIVGLLATVQTGMAAIATIAGVLGTTGLSILGHTLAIVAAVAAVGSLTRKWVSELVDVDLTFVNVIKLIKEGLVNAFALFVTRAKSGWLQTVQTMRIQFLKVVNFVKNAGRTVLKGLLAAASLVSDTAADALKNLKQQEKVQEKAQKKQIEREQEKLALLKEQLKEQEKQLQNVFDQNVEDILADNDENSIKDLVSDAVAGAGAALRGSINSVLDSIGGGLEQDLVSTAEEARSLSDVFDRIPGIIASSNSGLEDQQRLMERLKNEAEKARNALAFGLSNLGAEGRVRQQRKALFDAQIQFREDSEKIQRAITTSEQRLLNIERARERVAERINGLSSQEQDLVQRGVDAAERIFDLERRISAARIAGNEDEEAALRQRLEQEQQLADEILAGTSDERAKALGQIIANRVRLKGEEKTVDRQINRLQADRERLERQINQAAFDRVQLLAEQERFELSSQIREARVELESLQAEADVRFAPEAQQDLVAAQSKVRQAQLEAEQLERSQRAQERKLEATLAEVRAHRDVLRSQAEEADNAQRANDLRQRAAQQQSRVESIERQLADTRELNRLKQQQLNLELREARQEAERARAIAERPVEAGFFVALKQGLDQVTDKFRVTVDLMTSAIQRFSATVSRTIVDALDPTTDVDIRQRFADLMKSIAQTIIQTMVQIAAIRAALGLGFVGFGTGTAAAVGAGFAEGGEVPESPFRRARGYAAGRSIRPERPRGLPASDTVPIWATPGEWVMRLDAVRKYGQPVMERINQGLVDPTALKSLAGVRRSADRQEASRSPGFAAGGAIPSGVSGTSTVDSDGRTTPQGETPNIAVVAPTRQAFGRLLAGGRNEMLAFLEDNKEEVKALIGSS